MYMQNRNMVTLRITKELKYEPNFEIYFSLDMPLHKNNFIDINDVSSHINFCAR